MTPWLFILATLAAYRVSYAITREEGPIGVFAFMRGHIDPNQRTWLGRGLNCVLCISFWVTLIIALLLSASVLEWLAMAGLIVLWKEATTK